MTATAGLAGIVLCVGEGSSCSARWFVCDVSRADDDVALAISNERALAALVERFVGGDKRDLSFFLFGAPIRKPVSRNWWILRAGRHGAVAEVG